MRLPSFFLASALWLVPSLALAQTAPPPEHPPVPMARLHVDGPRFTQVLGRPIAGGDWTQVCSAPCDTPVPLDWQYRMRARGMKPSQTFQLDAGEDDDVVVRLHPAYTAWLVGGAVAASAGATTAVVGVPLLLLFRVQCGFVSNECTRENEVQFGVVTAVSAGLVALGVIAMVTNAETTVTQGEPAAVETPREPVWHTTERRDVPPLSATIGAPLVTLRF
jgi:hypothetical protein